MSAIVTNIAQLRGLSRRFSRGLSIIAVWADLTYLVPDDRTGSSHLSESGQGLRMRKLLLVALFA